MPAGCPLDNVPPLVSAAALREPERVNLVDRYAMADPEPIVVSWRCPAADALRAIGSAVAIEHLATVSGGERLVYRLAGTVDGRRLALNVSTSGTHMASSPAYSVTGEVRDTGAGSELRGDLSVPGAASRTWILVLIASAVIGVLLLAGGLAEVLPLWALGFVLMLFAPEIRSRTLRRRARDIESILATVGARPDDRGVQSIPPSR